MSLWNNEVIPVDKGRLRKVIRKKVAEILKGKTDAGDRVFPNSAVPSWVEELPVILVYPRAEPASKYSQAPRELERELAIEVEIVAKGPLTDEDGNEPIGQKSLEDILDDIAEQVECEMSRDETLGSTVDDSILTNTEFEFDGAGSEPIGSARLTFSATYFTYYPRNVDKQIDLDDFKKSEIDYHIGDAADTVEGNDDLDLPQI
jgi:hypothetical protein